MAIQQHRIVRFLMVLTAVLLTIFIYASYYSNSPMTIPQHLHSAALISTINNINNNEIDDDDNSGGRNSNGQIVVFDKQNSYKQQQQQSNSDAESNISYAQQYLDVGVGAGGGGAGGIGNGIEASIASSQQQSSLSNGFHKSSESGNTFNKNTATSTTSTTTNAANILNGTIQNRQNSNNNNITSSIASAVPSVNSINLSTSILSGSPSATTSLKNVDPIKGIRTGNIYESGHMDVNPLLCPDEGEGLRLLIIITSAPQHTDARLAIRQTWGHYGIRRDVAIAFIIGRTQNSQIEDSLTAENYMYNDLIRGHFIDSYNNLTLKTISALEWIDKNCQLAKFVLKTDDDMFINVPKLLQFIDKHSNYKNVIYGRLAKKWKPIRNKKSKYYVSQLQFISTIFPEFTTGPAYLLSSDIIHDLYIKSLEQTYLKLEDVYTTGIVAQLLQVKRIHVNEFLNRRIVFNPCSLRKAISVHMIKSNEQFDLWKKLLDTTPKCK